MRILVTGGNGFIGSYVCARLLELGHTAAIFDRVTGLSRLFTASTMYGPTTECHLGDVSNERSVSQSVYHSDGVIHLAGVLGTQETIHDPRPAAEVNLLGSLNVFQACALHKKRCVYIAVGNHWMNNPYSITKTAAERFALMYNKERGTEIAVVRGLNAYGPGQKSSPVRKIIPNFILPALKNEAISIYGDGSQVMDMIYVSDLAAILCDALFLDHGVYDRVFEAGTGRKTSVLEIAHEVIKQVGSGRVHHLPMRPGETEHSEVVADVSTLKPLGDFMPISLERGIAKTIPYYRAQVEEAVEATA